MSHPGKTLGAIALTDGQPLSDAIRYAVPHAGTYLVRRAGAAEKVVVAAP